MTSAISATMIPSQASDVRATGAGAGPHPRGERAGRETLVRCEPFGRRFLRGRDATVLFSSQVVLSHVAPSVAPCFQ